MAEQSNQPPGERGVIAPLVPNDQLRQAKDGAAGSRAWAEAEIVIALAGRCAEVRGRRANQDGWFRRPGRFESVCLHESGHAVCAAALGRFQQGIIVEQVSTGLRGMASNSTLAMPPSAGDPPTFKEGPSDFQTAVDFAKLVQPCGWRTYLRMLRRRAEELLDLHWLAVTLLAQEVQGKRIVPGERAQEILGRWMPIRERSLTEYLTTIRSRAT